MSGRPQNAESLLAGGGGMAQAAGPPAKITGNADQGLPVRKPHDQDVGVGAGRDIVPTGVWRRLRQQLKAVPWVLSSYRFVRLWLGLARFQQFAIAVYSGREPWAVGPPTDASRPVLTSRDVTDVPAAFVADPFLLRRDGRWFLFFEVMRADSWRGEIAVATSDDGVTWAYERVVLAEPFHLSYPHVFEWEGEVYMIPETFERNAVCLYRAIDFPYRWSLEAELISGATYADASVFRHGDRWWMFVEASSRDPAGVRPPRHDTLRLFWASSLTGPWTEHPKSPIVQGDARIARPAGRVLVTGEGRVLRFAQDCTSAYGRQVYAIEVTELDATSYRERLMQEQPILGPGRSPWHQGGMHHIDAHETEQGWLAAVDGWALRAVPRPAMVVQRSSRRVGQRSTTP